MFKLFHKPRIPSTSFSKRFYTVLGIETSCDDTCAAIVDSERGILAARRDQNWTSQLKIGGISPFLAAQHHRKMIDFQVHTVINKAGIRYKDLDGVAVSTEPGLVICLKVGVDKALAVCRDHSLSFIPVHHMKAHALSARFNNDIEFPFVALLISGGHSIIALVNDPENFQIIGQAISSSSPGEAIDKVARILGLPATPHYGAQVEKLAEKSDKVIRYVTRLPHTSGADMDFVTLRELFLTALRREKDLEINDFCRNLQHMVTSHLCQKLDVALSFINSKSLVTHKNKSLVVAGGVSANKYIRDCVANVASHYGYRIKVPLPQMITDNAEMIAWTGIELLNKR
ncbi:unnamed protein product [Bursaphelenchus okinawaensis]|uniref:N(6)-L-threonylcarbamoyladenine synthase n=1 Tax=Bursaphelenchus okinawaensis TaxID=465554 RepID=A0A811LAF7_9BILA|nr:unnamed protein product [Bursaphelenchus okinawaensis]CAG9119689.1 unnamed protein product [Bursaphelenchus okinawaensis]